MKKGFVYVVITAVLFTMLEPASKLLAGAVHPLSLTALRFLLGGLVLLPFALAKCRRDGVWPAGRDWLNISLLGILCICVSMGLLQLAVFQANSAALIAIVFSANAVFTIVFAALILRERVTPLKIAALVLCLAGVLLSANIRAGEKPAAVALAVAAALTFSLYTVLSKKLMARCAGIVQTSFSFLIGGAVFALGLAAFGISPAAGVTLSNLWIVAFLGVAVTGAGYWAYFAAMRDAGAFAASFVFFIKPMFAPFAAWWVLGARPDNPWLYFSLALVAAGSILGSLSRRPAKKAGV